MIKDSKEAWYRKMDYMTLEFQWGRRKGPGLPFVLKVRSVKDPVDIYEYEVMDINTAPIGAYLRQAELSMVEKAERKAKDDRLKRSQQFDRNDAERMEVERQAREARDHAAKKKEKQLAGGIGEPEGQAQGGAPQDDGPEGNDKVRLDRFSEPPKKKRGRPRKHRESGGEAGDGRPASH